MIVELWNSGLTQLEVAEAAGCSQDRVRRALALAREAGEYVESRKGKGGNRHKETLPAVKVEGMVGRCRTVVRGHDAEECKAILRGMGG